MPNPACTEPELSPLPTGREGPERSLRRRRFLQHLGWSTLSMTGVISASHALHRDPQLSAALSSVARFVPETPVPPSALLEDTEFAPGPPGSIFDPANYREFLATIPLRHISIHQIVRCHFKKRGEVANQLPPKDLWLNIAPTLLLADELAQRLAVPLLEITSAYRSPEYNALIQGAAEGSYHIRNQALDLKFDCPVARMAEVAHALRKEGRFQGGIGIYPTFLHLDTRGKNVDWGDMPATTGA